MGKYELVLLDADETLFDFKKAEDFAFSNAFAAFGLEPREGLLAVYDEINKELWARLERGETNQESLKVERFRLLFEAEGLGLDPGAFSRVFVEWLSRGTFLLDGAEEMTRYLSERYTLAIVTNGLREVQVARVRDSAIGKYVDHLVVSEEAGSSKPEAGIFEYACAAAGIRDRERILIVGDSLGSDIKGGLDFGIDACWLNPSGAPNPTELRPTYEIRSLLELKTIL